MDDSEQVVNMLQQGLRKMGHTVFTALSGEEGLRLLDEQPVEIVIGDLAMPDMDGRKAVSRCYFKFERP